MAGLYTAWDDLDKAETLLKRAQPILEADSDGDESKLIPLIVDLAYLDYARGRYDEAEQKYLREKAIAEKTYGPQHHYVEDAWRNLSFVYQASGQGERAVSAREAANDLAEQRIAVVVASGSEDLKRSFMAHSAIEADYTVTLHVRSVPESMAARRLALTAILRHKGRVLDVMADMLGSIRTRAGTSLTDEERTLLDSGRPRDHSWRRSLSAKETSPALHAWRRRARRPRASRQS